MGVLALKENNTAAKNLGEGDILSAYSAEQIELIKATVVPKETTLEELKLFLYTCKKLNLDPLLKEVHLLEKKKYNRRTDEWEKERCVVVTGITGFRIAAARSKMHKGTKRGATYDDKGKLIGGWAEVYRQDWQIPVREEVSFWEYCQADNEGKPKGTWKTKPETMIKKVAEAAALRIAFPEELSGVYIPEEFGTTEEELSNSSGAVATETPTQKNMAPETENEPIQDTVTDIQKNQSSEIPEKEKSKRKNKNKDESTSGKNKVEEAPEPNIYEEGKQGEDKPKEEAPVYVLKATRAGKTKTQTPILELALEKATGEIIRAFAVGETMDIVDQIPDQAKCRVELEEKKGLNLVKVIEVVA